MKRSYGWRWLIYLLGLLILALGITLNTKTGFGVSPIISVAFSVSCIWNQKLGDMTFALYVLYDVIEMAVHVGIWMRSRRCGKPYSLKSMICFDILQIPLGLVFSRFINVYSAILPDFTTDFQGQFLGSLAGRLLMLMLAVICTGVGCAMSMDMRLIPNPADGAVQALADFSGVSVGLSKNCFDVANIVVTVILCMTVAEPLYGIGLGTIVSMLGTGRVIAFFNKLFLKRLNHIANIDLSRYGMKEAV